MDPQQFSYVILGSEVHVRKDADGKTLCGLDATSITDVPATAGAFCGECEDKLAVKRRDDLVIDR